MISIIHPSRSRPEKSWQTISRWIENAFSPDEVQLIVSVDIDDTRLNEYKDIYDDRVLKVNSNKSSVEAINKAAALSGGDILIVVSDDTESIEDWDAKILDEVEGKTDWILKTQDGIQNYIITFPIMDRAYFNRAGYIYHPDFDHMFCDTYMSCVADINRRRITSQLIFPHNNDSIKDDLRKRTDATWKQGEETFIRLMKQFTPEERSRIQDPSMRNWLRNKGVR